MSDPTTRPHAYELVAKESGISVTALRVAAHRAGLTVGPGSPRYALPAEYEDVLVTVYIIHARQGTPLTRAEFVDLANKFAKREEDHFFTKGFVKTFVDRHRDQLSEKPGKSMSPTRSFEDMQDKTLEFVSSLNGFFEKNIINRNNLVVFDETVVCINDSLPLAIGERRTSGGGNVNVVQTHQSALFCYIPFSLGDGSTPFRVVIYKSENLEKGAFSSTGLVPVEEKGLRDTPYRLFLESGTGYLTLELFKYSWKSSRNGGPPLIPVFTVLW